MSHAAEDRQLHITPSVCRERIRRLMNRYSAHSRSHLVAILKDAVEDRGRR